MTKPHYIIAGWLIDGSGGAIRKKVLLTISNGIFTGVDNYNSSDSPDTALVTDLSHCTILPPFIDSHVHLSMSGTIDQSQREQQLVAGYERLGPVIAEHIAHHFSHGVLAVRDGGDRQGSVLRYKTEKAGREREPVALKVAGRAWYQKGRYGALIGRHPADGETLSEVYAAENTVIDQVKLVNSGVNSLRLFARETPPQFSLKEMESVVLQAEKQDRKVMVHANGRLPVSMAIEAGCHSIEHGYFMGSENLQLMADKQIFWVPTLYAMKSCAEDVDNIDGSADKKVAEKNLEHQLEQVALARKFGVKIALGTDAGSIGVLHGEALVEEMKLLIKAGYSLAETIRCSTNHGAQLLGMENELGLIAKEKPAHFLVARGTPAQLPRKLSYLEAIYRHGSPSTFYRR